MDSVDLRDDGPERSLGESGLGESMSEAVWNDRLDIRDAIQKALDKIESAASEPLKPLMVTVPSWMVELFKAKHGEQWRVKLAHEIGVDPNELKTAMIDCKPCPSTQFVSVQPPVVTDEDRAFVPRVIRFLLKGERPPADRAVYTYGTGGEIIPASGVDKVMESHVFFVYLTSLWEERKAGYRLPSPLPRAPVDEDEEPIWQLQSVPSARHN